MKAIILAAGVGSRFGRPYPKCLSVLPYGERIIERQIRILRKCGVKEIIAVVGFKKELIMEIVPDISFIYNPVYYITNTAKSLLRGIEYLSDDVVWLNGDVIFEDCILENLLSGNKTNKLVVNRNKCDEEAVGYILTKDGNNILKVSKNLYKSHGEAVGINMIISKHLEKFKEKLRACKDTDYYEKAIELLIEDNVDIEPFFVDSDKCIEVDFDEDWVKACSMFDHV